MKSAHNNKTHNKHPAHAHVAHKANHKKKLFLLAASLVLFFTLFSFSSIRAQIASIISEDGDGIVGITSLMNATINNDVDAVKFFSRSEGHKVVNQKNVGGATALHIAARNGNIEIAKVLIDNGANVDIADNEGWTPLMRAATSGNADLIQFLLQSGADAGKMNSDKETAIIHSASSECVQCLNNILSGYNFIDQMNGQILWDQINQAMDIATRKNNEPIRSLLKEYVIKKMGKVSAAGKYSGSANKFDNDVVTVRSLDDQSSGKKTTSGQAYKLNKNHNDDSSGGQRFVYKLDDKKDYNLSEDMPSGISINKPIKLKNKIPTTSHSGSRYKFLGETKPYDKKSIPKKIIRKKKKVLVAPKSTVSVAPAVTTPAVQPITVTNTPKVVPTTTTTSTTTSTANTPAANTAVKTNNNGGATTTTTQTISKTTTVPAPAANQAVVPATGNVPASSGQPKEVTTTTTTTTTVTPPASPAKYNFSGDTTKSSK